MAQTTKIEWCDATFNPWIGCTKVSPGCLNCYAETRSKRTDGVQWGNGQPRRRTSESNWNLPIKWDRSVSLSQPPPRVFCASLADWLDPEVPVEWLSDLLYLMVKCPMLNWLLLTKRPQLWMTRMQAVAKGCDIGAQIAGAWLDGNPPPHIWIGTSAEDQLRWDERMPHLMSIPARIRFVSAEPLVGRIHMGHLRPDWLIVGGESGRGARPMAAGWVEHLRDQCDDRTAFFFKQWGGIYKDSTGRIQNGRTWDEFPLGSDKWP